MMLLTFCMPTVPIAYGDFVLLDKHWADLAQKLKLPPDRVKVYSPKHVLRSFWKILNGLKDLD